jgi:glyoxylase-like metal-dependent hydrolase (beta-lactamase superfamily II)
MLAPFEHSGLPVRRPDATFSGSRELAVGSRTAHALEVGPAHTAGDAVVHVPHAGVVFCGDILFRGVTPVVWHGPVAGWIAALDRCLALDADRFVPGHGPMADRDDLTALREYWTWLLSVGREEHAAGREPLAAARRIIRTEGFGRWRSWLVPERLVLNVVAYFRELDGQPPLETNAVNRLRLFRLVADLAAGLH